MIDSQREPSERQGWFHEIFRRRVPQALGLYMGACWGVIQFVQWLIERYDLSRQLDHVAFVTCLLILPSILLLTWGHGEPGRQGWTRIEKIGIPANLVFAGVLLPFVAGGGTEDVATRRVTVTDEDGTQVEKTVPKQEYRRSMILLGLENRSGDPDLEWLEDGVTALVALDLSQSLFVNPAVPLNSGNLRSRLRHEGFANGSGMPLPLQLDVARDFHVRYFVSGSFTGSPDELAVQLSLFEAKTGKAVAEHELTGADPFLLADEITKLLQRDMEIPEAELAAAEDLPVREFVTSSSEAFETLVRGIRKTLYERSYTEGRELLDRAVALDETFAMAHFLRSNICKQTNESGCAVESLEAAMRYIYRFPPFLEFEVKNAFYLYKGDQDKRLALNRMRAEMFPDDENAYLNLAVIHRQNNRWAEAISAYERALETAPEAHYLYLDLGRTHIRSGQPEKAREYYETYAELFPDEAETFSELGYFHESVGEYEAARRQYEKALLLEPGNVGYQLELGDVELYLGRWAVGRQIYEDVLAASELPEDRSRAHYRLEEYFRYRGQPTRLVEHMEARFAEREAYAGRLGNLVQRIYGIHNYVRAGQEERAREVLRSLEEEIEPPFDRVAIFGHVRIAVMLGDVEAAEQRLEELDRLSLELGDQVGGIRIFRQAVLARLEESKQAFGEALAHYRKGLELAPSEKEFLVDILRCQRRLGRLEEARETRAEVLRMRPFDPRAHYEAALLHAELGERDEAVEHLTEAMTVWAEAEPVFELAKEARAKLEELGRS